MARVPFLRAECLALAQIAEAFEREADRVRQTRQRIRRSLETLQGGDWVGQGADAFYREMTAEVLPALNRLLSALGTAARTIRSILQIMKDLEEQVARLFAAMLALWASGFGRGVGEGIVGALGAGVGAVVGAAQAVAAAAERMLSGMDPKVAEIARQSPTLQANLAQLERDGWTITTRNGGGSETDHQHHTMVIDTSEAPETQVGSLAHESSHARYGVTPFHQPTAGMTRDQFIETNLRENMMDEANAQFSEAAVRDEVLGNGGPDTGVSGTQSADYQHIYNDFRDGNITREQAIRQMADIFPNETTGNTGETYRDCYTPTYANWWDTNVAPTRGAAP